MTVISGDETTAGAEIDWKTSNVVALCWLNADVIEICSHGCQVLQCTYVHECKLRTYNILELYFQLRNYFNVQ